MANLYVRSSDGNNSDNGTTWALAKATIAGAAAIDAAGDTIYISQAHSETTASGFSVALAGSLASPTRVICGNDGAEPPTSVDTTAQIASTGASSITFTGTCFYVYGLKISCGSGSNAATLNCCNTSAHNVLWESSQFLVDGANVASFLSAGLGGVTRWRNCDVRFSNASQTISGTSRLVWEGGSLLAGGTSPTTLMALGVSGALLSGVDLSAGGSSMNIFTASGAGGSFVVRDSKLPASWSGSLVTGALGQGERHELFNCDSGDTNYRLWVEDYTGTIKQETTIVLTGGASDGTTSLSWRMVTSANAKVPHLLLVSPEIMVWNDTVGSSVTATVEIVHDSQGAGSGSKFQDDEIWLEVMYLGTSGYPLGSWASDRAATVIATAANQADSTATWTTTGLSSPVKQKLEVTFTPQEKGYVVGRVVVAKASKTVYVDPAMTVA